MPGIRISTALGQTSRMRRRIVVQQRVSSHNWWKLLGGTTRGRVPAVKDLRIVTTSTKASKEHFAHRPEATTPEKIDQVVT